MINPWLNYVFRAGPEFSSALDCHCPRWPPPWGLPTATALCPAQLLGEHSHATTVTTTFRSSNGVPSDHSPSVGRDAADHVMEC